MQKGEITIYSNGFAHVRLFVESSEIVNGMVRNISTGVIEDSIRVVGSESHHLIRPLIDKVSDPNIALLETLIGRDVTIEQQIEHKKSKSSKLVTGKLSNINASMSRAVVENENTLTILNGPLTSIQVDISQRENVTDASEYALKLNKAPLDEVQVEYVTRGLDWKISYSFDLTKTQDESFIAMLTATAIIDNVTQIAYENYAVELVKGSINVEEPMTMPRTRQVQLERQVQTFSAPTEYVEQAQAELKQKSAFDTYQVRQLVDIPKQENISTFQELFTVDFDNVQKLIMYDSQRSSSGSSDAFNEAELVFVFDNDNQKESLPSGTINVYEDDTFVGSLSINRIALGQEDVHLFVGKLPNTQVQRRVVSERTSQAKKTPGIQNQYKDIEITIDNNADEARIVHLVEHFERDQWEIIPFENSQKPNFKPRETVPNTDIPDYRTAVAPLSVDAKSRAKYQYTIKYSVVNE